jgi:hypothetical protein
MERLSGFLNVEKSFAQLLGDIVPAMAHIAVHQNIQFLSRKLYPADRYNYTM